VSRQTKCYCIFVRIEVSTVFSKTTHIEVAVSQNDDLLQTDIL
jgi:hypothetical protein